MKKVARKKSPRRSYKALYAECAAFTAQLIEANKNLEALNNKLAASNRDVFDLVKELELRNIRLHNEYMELSDRHSKLNKEFVQVTEGKLFEFILEKNRVVDPKQKPS